MKLLIINIAGIQEVIEVGEGGGYFDQSKVLWDENVDGQLPNITLGGMERVGSELVFNQTVLNATQAIQLDRDKADKIRVINETNTSRSPVLINGVTYHGGDLSAIAIKGAIDLALSKNEPSVKIWDVNDLTQVYTFAEANHIAVTIADEYQTKQFTTKDRITAVNAITIDPQGTYPDYASAKAALDLI